MKALVLHGAGRGGINHRPAPLPGVADAVVDVLAVALCGSDLKLYDGEMHDAEYPMVPGHEWAGRVASAPGRPELEGAIVVGDNLIPCAACAACTDGRSNLCESLDEVGFTLPGACADQVCLPASHLRPLPADTDPGVACLVEPLAVALHAVERSDVGADDDVLVLGAGAVGLLAAQAARAAGATTTVADPQAARLGVAAEFGLTTLDADATAGADSIADVVIEASGAPEAFTAALRLVRPSGTVCQLGYGSMRTTEVAPSWVMLKELTIVGSLSAHGTWDRAVALVAEGRVELAPLVSHRLPLDQFAAAFDLLRRPTSGALRVVLEP